MSRIGKKPIALPQGIRVDINGDVVSVTNGKQTLTQVVDPRIRIELTDGELQVIRTGDAKEDKALHGLYRSLIANMVQGLSAGFQKNLEINGVGFRAAKAGSKLTLTLGYSHPIELEEPAGITIEVPAANRIVVRGADKQLVGETAARIRALRVPDPYKGKGIKYDYEVLRLREGKTGAR
ncbi:MAG: 50S ribosomal protein L6 [Bacillota bacterium]|nr:50S ribosomal protein L6 [Bacillota bacterium]